jgi:fluoroquinolone transport system permease protein
MTALFPKRLYNTMLWDVRLQFRNGFYYATLVVAVVSTVLLRQLPQDTLAWVLPIFVLGNLLMNGFYFVSGLVLLERVKGQWKPRL